ncbi:uncharacterized protein AMSG_03981 [Thecamonas trahens ATCC 50062]|uniref:Uncharacterized protein n=1 Tax=Thecamonas trahens ATCC 50062 TaxID=461836 RepID=A0A0L0D5X1_THETB|nr:hypothetical protein AMSG_03981 [Thecamonas trahens ATCC 50062]KNC47754.1 hypothetical protein AMSG_03981 [Thecamonas trahens ATCC 50062]|eukprot:XP_013759232.1 hypothetical protein AMSG_03981 [Thecamonas trahens ATCC 50062]
MAGLPFVVIRGAPLVAGGRDGGLMFMYPSRGFQLGLETLWVSGLNLALVGIVWALLDPPRVARGGKRSRRDAERASSAQVWMLPLVLATCSIP